MATGTVLVEAVERARVCPPLVNARSNWAPTGVAPLGCSPGTATTRMSSLLGSVGVAEICMRAPVPAAHVGSMRISGWAIGPRPSSLGPSSLGPGPAEGMVGAAPACVLEDPHRCERERQECQDRLSAHCHALQTAKPT